MATNRNYKIQRPSNSLVYLLYPRLFINIKGGVGNDLRRVFRGWMHEQSLGGVTRIDVRIDRDGCYITPIPVFNLNVAGK